MVINSYEGAGTLSQIAQVVHSVSVVILDDQVPLAYSTLAGCNSIFIMYNVIIKELSGSLVHFQ